MRGGNFVQGKPILGSDGQYHFVYAVINKINGKLYFGKHSTTDISDGYMGSGKLLIYAQDKYGRQNFRRIDLAFFDDSESAFEFEELLVDDAMVNEDWCYNIMVGGSGGKTRGNSGMKHSSDTKKLLSQMAMGRTAHNKGKPMADSTKDKLREVRLGKKAERTVCSLCGQLVANHHMKRHLKSSGRCLAKQGLDSNGHKTCRYCGIKTLPGNIKRWHNENCKQYRELSGTGKEVRHG